ncbi:MAG: hypothetical protein ACKVXR_15285 [Planctomycetota bacterium]
MSLVDVLLWMSVSVALPDAYRAARTGMPHLAAFTVLVLLGVGLVFVAAASENAWEIAAREDGLIEWATVAAFGLTLALHIKILVTTRSSAKLVEKLTRGAIALFCFFVAGEEISWGQRLFGFRPPEIFLERNFQQELNLHNVLMSESSGLGFAVDSKHVVALIALAFVLVLPRLVLHPLLAGARALAPGRWLLPAGLAVVAAELSYPVDLCGEGAELFLGLVLLAAVSVEGRFSPVQIGALLFAPILFGSVAAPIVSRVLYGADEAGVQITRAELELLRSDLDVGALPKLVNRGSVHKRVFTAVNDKYLNVDGRSYLEGRNSPASALDGLRNDRRGYFLDPWNNPIWIHWDKQKKRAVLYSFGPNRLRDSNWRRSDESAGDDIAVVWVRTRTAKAAEDAAEGAPAIPNGDSDGR